MKFKEYINPTPTIEYEDDLAEKVVFEKDPSKLHCIVLGLGDEEGTFADIVGKITKKKPRIFNLHPKLIEFFLRTVGQKKILESLIYDLQINSEFLFEDLDWKPVTKPLTMEKFIKYLDKKNN